MTPDAPDYLRTLATFVVESDLASLGPAARAAAQQVLYDSLPVIAAGMQVPEMQALLARQRTDATPGRAAVIGAACRASALDAALLNGTAGTWLELNEGSLVARGHPSMQVVPAALAAAQELQAPGEQLLAALALGYEVCARIGRAAEVKLTIHPHGTWGVIGAAVAAGKLRGFDVPAMIELINVAATMGMATARKTLLEGSTVRNIFTGHSGYMGLMAGRLVDCGFTGLADGPGAIYAGVLSDTFDPARVVDRLGEEWLVTQGYYKLHPTGRYVHAALDALDDVLATLPGGRLDPALIARIDVRAYKLAAMLDGRDVTSSFGARFSIPFALAATLHHGASSLAAFEAAAVAHPLIRDTARRIVVTEDPGHTAAYPQTQRCDLLISLTDGRLLRGHCEVMKGEPGNPHSPAALRAKFHALGRDVWGEARTAQLWDHCMSIEHVADVSTLDL